MVLSRQFFAGLFDRIENGAQQLLCFGVQAGNDPTVMGGGPIFAVRKLFEKTGLSPDDIGPVELNEAFAAQAIACCRELQLAEDRPNELGSGISIGHPIGCTGARQMVTAMNNMVRKGYNTGLISMCIGGGMGMAMIVER